MIKKWLIIISLLVIAQCAMATPAIEVLALFTDRAMLRIDNEQHLLKVGDVTVEGVKLLSATSKKAVVEYEGKEYVIEPKTIIRGEYKSSNASSSDKTQPSSVPASAKSEVIINADINDQYLTTATINGQNVTAIVDTGANTVAMSSQHAATLGIDFMSAGMAGSAQTASGVATMYMVKLNSVKIGSIEISDVDAAVLEGEFPETLLLGMSFLNKLHMVQEKGVMKLTQKDQPTSPPASTPVATTPVAAYTPVVTPPQN